MIKPAMSLYPFLPPSCFLDRVPYLHHQAQFLAVQRTFIRSLDDKFQRRAGFVVPANQCQAPLLPSDPSPNAENMATAGDICI